MRKFLFTKVWQREMLHNRGQFCQGKFLHMTKKFFRRKFSFHLFFQKKKKPLHSLSYPIVRKVILAEK